jgi:3-hydroxyacyl-CoA dehydrogenase
MRLLGYGHPMGPLELTDLVGLDVCLGVAEYLSSALGPAFTPPALLRAKVADGKHGKRPARASISGRVMAKAVGSSRLIKFENLLRW